MDEKRRHTRAFRFFSALVRPFFKKFFHYSYEPIPAVAGPYILLCNHNMEIDPILLGLAAPHQHYYVASEHIARKGFGTWFLMRYFKPILHAKGKTGLQSSIEILRAVKRGDSVAMFPEGNRSFNGLTCDIFPATGKLVRRSGATLITYRIEGGYFSQPRWSKTLRRGKLHGVLAGVYSPEELSAMTVDEVNALIARDLHEDAYATQARTPVAYRGKQLGEGLETTLFTCPKCGRIGKLQSKNDMIWCSCGFIAQYDEYGKLIGSPYPSVTAWDAWQQQQLQAAVENAGEGDVLFSDEVTVYRIEEHAIAETTTGTLRASKTGFTLCGRELPFAEVEGVAIFSRNNLNIYAGAQFEVRGAEDFCALKYRYLYDMIRRA